jgi:hypothetical protein
VSELIASLIQQLSMQQNTVPYEVRALYLSHRPSRTRPVLLEYLNVLRDLTAHFSQVYIVIDALDECEEVNGTRKTLIEELRNLSGARVLFTSRYLGDIEQMLHDVPRLEVRASDSDISCFLRYQIRKERRLVAFCKQDPTLHDDLIEKIIRQADGM